MRPVCMGGQLLQYGWQKMLCLVDATSKYFYLRFNVDCTLAASFYGKNEGLFAGAEAGGGGGSCPQV